MTFANFRAKVLAFLRRSLLENPAGAAKAGSKGRYDSFMTALIVSVFAWFCFQASYFARHTVAMIAPDEHQHFYLSKMLYEQGAFILKDVPLTYFFGPISAEPSFYWVLMSKLFHLNFFDVDLLQFARHLNVVISAIGLYFAYLLVRFLTPNKIIQFCALLLQSSILMYVFISGMVHYDNYINASAWASLYFLVKFLRSERIVDLLVCACISFFAAMAKMTFLPLGVIYAVTLLLSGRLSPQNLMKARSTFQPKHIPLLILMLLGFAGTVKIYGTNLMVSGGLSPRCDRVLPIEVCKEHTAAYRLSEELNAEAATKPRVSLPNFLRAFLIDAEQRALSIYGHQPFIRQRMATHRAFHRLYLAVFLAFLLNLRNLVTNRTLMIFLGVSAAYGAVIIAQNYFSYLGHGLYGLGLQGRYWFPVLAPAVGAAMYILLHRLKDSIKLALTLIICGYSTYAGFFFALRELSSSVITP